MKRHENQPANSRGKLTPAQVRAIREKSIKCRTIIEWAELGAKYGVSGSVARKVANHSIYAWVA